MSFRGMRRALGAEPRWMIAVLLAFAIETLPPSTLFVQHRHAAGDVAHTHAGLVHARGVDGSPRTLGDGITRSPASDLHGHAVHPVVLVGTTEVAAPAPTLVASTVSRPPVPEIPTVASSPGQARAPPHSFEA